MKATSAVMQAIARLQAEGRTAETRVDPAKLAAAGPFAAVAGETEKQFMHRLIAYAQARGWRVAHFRPMWDKTGSRMVTAVAGDGKGFPDLELVRERLVKVECKVGKRPLEPDQALWRDAYRKAGVEWYLWRPADHEEIGRVLA